MASTGFRRKFFGIRRARGFTLVELLVVISIIALLIAILLPSLAKAREQSKCTICLTNLQGIAKASLTYATDDAHEQSVPVHQLIFYGNLGKKGLAFSRFGFGGKSGIGNTPGGTSQENSPFGTKYPNNMGPSTRPLNPTIYKNKFNDYSKGTLEEIMSDTKLPLKIYKCPSDKGYPGGVESVMIWGQNCGWAYGLPGERISAFDYFGNSYTAQQMWVYWIGGKPHNFLMSNTPFLRPVSRVPNPSRTVLFQEMGAMQAHQYPRPEDNDPDDPNIYGDRREFSKANEVAKGWHKKDFTFNMAFTDGHAEFLHMKGCFCEDVVGYSGTGCGGVSGQNGTSRRIVVRGPRWKLDTLPSDPIITQIVNPGGAG